MSRLELPEDFRDLLVALADARADFVLIGGWAMAVYGRARATEDLDVLVRATAANSAKVFAALAAFGAPVGPHGVDGRMVPVIGRAALLRNKRAAGRHKDLDDVEWLERGASKSK